MKILQYTHQRVHWRVVKRIFRNNYYMNTGI